MQCSEIRELLDMRDQHDEERRNENDELWRMLAASGTATTVWALLAVLFGVLAIWGWLR